MFNKKNGNFYHHYKEGRKIMENSVKFSDVVAILVYKIQQMWNEYGFSQEDFLEDIPQVKFVTGLDYDFDLI